MSWLLTDKELAEAREGIHRGAVTVELYEFVGRLVGATARRGVLPPALSPTGKWDDEAIEEAVQAWFEHRLLRGALLRAFDRCVTPASLSRYLESAFHNWLRSRARAQQRPRLLRRAREILESDPDYRRFIEADSWVDDWWGLEAWTEPEQFQGDVAVLLRPVYALGELNPLRFTGNRADPVLSTDDLKRVLRALVVGADALLSLRQIDEALRARFPHDFVEEAALTEEPELTAEGPTPLDEVSAIESARHALARLSQRQLLILVGRFGQRLTLDELAGLHACSRGTIDNEVRRAVAIISETINEANEFQLVLEKILDLASLEHDG
jgi:RNA polymerase sigma factor (sigma-70 family)